MHVNQHLSDLATYSSKSCNWWEKWLNDSNNEWFVLGDIGQPNIFNVISKLVLRIEALEVDNQNMANEIKKMDEKLDQIVSSDKSEEESSVTAITPSTANESGKCLMKLVLQFGFGHFFSI